MWPNHGTLLNNRTNSPKILLNNLHIKSSNEHVLPIFWATLRNTWIPIFCWPTRGSPSAHQAAHFNLLWPNEVHIIGVMEEFETGATFTLGPAFPPGAMDGNSAELDMNWI